jgi:L-malate glycosyltransferase
MAYAPGATRSSRRERDGDGRVRILYVNHTAEFSGAERSLLGLLGALPDSVAPRMATPRGGLLTAVADLGIPTTTITGTAGSLRLHPLHTPRAIADMSIAAWQVRAAVRRHRAELLHANSIRAGIVLALARAPRAATVVHVRDCLPPGALSAATMRLIARASTTLVANSQYTARSVHAFAPGARVKVVYNPVDLRRWDPARIDRADARARLGGAAAHRVLLGVVAQLSPWKGQDTAIDALRYLRDDGIDAHLVIVGSAKFVARATRFDNEAYVARLHALVADWGLEDRVSWLGERDDVPELMRALDVLLLPSWEEPFGRAVIEAMALGVPVIATNVGGPAEIIEDGREGYLLAPRQPRAWAAAVRRLAEDPQRGREMGSAGRRRVQQAFTLDHHVAAMVELYEDAIALAGQAPP